jgi:hypothetical protein
MPDFFIPLYYEDFNGAVFNWDGEVIVSLIEPLSCNILISDLSLRLGDPAFIKFNKEILKHYLNVATKNVLSDENILLDRWYGETIETNLIPPNTDIVLPDNCRLIKDVFVNNKPAVFKDEKEFYHLLNNINYQDIFLWTKWGRNTIKINPIDKILNIKIFYYRYPKEMVGDNDIIDIPEKYVNSVLQLAVALCQGQGVKENV